MSFFLLRYDSNHPKNTSEATEGPFLREEVSSSLRGGPRRSFGSCEVPEASPSGGAVSFGRRPVRGLTVAREDSLPPAVHRVGQAFEPPPTYGPRACPADPAPGTAPSHSLRQARSTEGPMPRASGLLRFRSRQIARSMRRLTSLPCRLTRKVMDESVLRRLIPLIRMFSSRYPLMSTISCSGRPM